MVNGSPVFSPCMCGILPSLLKTVEEKELNELALSIEPVIIRLYESLMAAIFPISVTPFYVFVDLRPAFNLSA